MVTSVGVYHQFQQPIYFVILSWSVLLVDKTRIPKPQVTDKLKS